jgi:hypothetical protein
MPTHFHQKLKSNLLNDFLWMNEKPSLFGEGQVEFTPAERVGALSTVGKLIEEKPVSIPYWTSTGFLI